MNGDIEAGSRPLFSLCLLEMGQRLAGKVLGRCRGQFRRIAVL